MTRPHPSLRLGVIVVLAVLASLLAPASVAPALAGGPADPAETVTTLRVTPDSPIYGEDSITMEAAVEAGGRPVTTGLVDFYAILGQQEIYLGEADFDDNGVAVRTVELTEIGRLQAGQAFQVAATYLPADFEVYASSTSERVVVSTRAGGSDAEYTGTTVTGPYAATVGVPTDLTAEVFPVEAAGTVQFRVAGQPVGEPVPVEAGEASLPSYTFDTAGWVKLSAFFTPSDPEAFRASDHALEVAVAPAAAEPVATTTTVTGPATATSGVPTTLTAEVRPAEAAGTVQFYVDEEPVGDPVPVEAGEASLPSYTFRGRGAVGVIAVFTPADEEAFASSENWLEVDVADPPFEPLETTTTMTGPATATVGVATELIAEVSPADVEGWVQFRVDGDPVGEPVEAQAGEARASYTFDSAGIAEVSAEFLPAYIQSYRGSDDTLEVDVAPAAADPVATTTTVTGPATATSGVATTLTAEVSPAGAAGTVQFLVDGDEVGAPAALRDGRAALSHTFGAAGRVSVTAVFTPADLDAYAGSEDAVGRTLRVESPYVPPTPTTTSLIAPGTATVGQPVDLVATVSPTTDGTVQFLLDGQPVAAPVPVAFGRAVLRHTFTTAATTRLGATFTPSSSSYAGSEAPSRSIEVQRAETSVRVGAPSGAVTGRATTLTARVTPADVAGTVTFSVDGSPVGSPVTVSAGAASLDHAFPDAGAATVTATFTPADATAYAASSDATGVRVTVSRPATTVVVSGPASVTVGEPAALTAVVSPADAAGTVTFVVGGKSRTVPVTSGVAELAHTFVTPGRNTVLATFDPASGSGYPSSVAEALVLDVAAGATSAAGGASIGTAEATVDSGDSGLCVGTSTRSRAAGPEGVFGVVFETMPVWRGMPQETFLISGRVPSATFRFMPCGLGRAAATQEVVRAQCVPVASGVRCPVELPRFASLSATLAVPLPAAAAGKQVRMRSSLTTIDAETGETLSLGSDTVTVRAPERTSLTARLAPVRSGVASVRPGGAVAYRVAVANPGRYAADDVRACVRVGQGARIRAASGATVRGQRVCWTVPSLAKGATVVRRLTVVAPRTPGDLTVRAVVTPRKKQADVVRLRTALPVR